MWVNAHVFCPSKTIDGSRKKIQTSLKVSAAINCWRQILDCFLRLFFGDYLLMQIRGEFIIEIILGDGLCMVYSKLRRVNFLDVLKRDFTF